MNAADIDKNVYLIKRNLDLSEQAESFLRRLSDDDQINPCGVFISGIEKFDLSSDKVTATIEAVRGNTGHWFHELHWAVKLGGWNGFSYAPSISQGIRGELCINKHAALQHCIDLLKYRVKADLNNYPDHEKIITRKIDAFCIDQFGYPVTLGLPLFTSNC